MAETTLRQRLAVWFALLALLGLNLGGAFLDLGAARAPLTLALAAIQAALIAGLFMGLAKSTPILGIAAAAGFFWLLLMFGLVLGDYGTRAEDIALGRLIPESPPRTPATPPNSLP